MPPIRHETLVPIGLDDEEQTAALDDIASLYFAAQDNGLNPVAGIETTPDGDVFTIELADVE